MSPSYCQVLRTDIVMDVGESMNPAIDIGQIEGGFVQGLGLFTTELPLFNAKTGEVMTRGPYTYKVPTKDDIPNMFNVSLLRGAPNPRAIYSSKVLLTRVININSHYTVSSLLQGLGEAPLFLAASVFFAIRDAICAARRDSDLDSYFQLDSPATAERIRMACEDVFTRQVKFFFQTLSIRNKSITSIQVPKYEPGTIQQPVVSFV